MGFGEIESILVKINGVFFDVHIDPDYDAKPGYYDCYSDADKAAFDAGQWRFVGVTVAVHDHPSLTESLWGVEWGEMPTAIIDISRVVADHARDLVGALRAELVALLDTWEA